MKYILTFIGHLFLSVFFYVPYLIYHICYFVWHFKIGEYPKAYKIEKMYRGCWRIKYEYITPMDYLFNKKSYRRADDAMENFYWLHFEFDEEVG